LKRRVRPSWAVRGVVFFLALSTASCLAPTGSPDADSPEARPLIIGVPESNVSGSEIGFGQFLNLLSLEGLIYVGADGRPTPWLAQRWAWEDDYRRLRVYLRPNAYLHDGRRLEAPIAAELVRQAIANSKALYPALNDVADVRPEGQFELVFDLSRPSGQLPEDLSVPLRTSRAGTVVGTGPFRIVSTDPEELRLEGFEDYYLGRPSVQQVRVRPIPTLRTSWSSLLRGDVDVVTDVPADAVAFIRNDDVRVFSFARWYQFVIAFNSQKGPLQSPDVRRALNLAVDRTALIDNVLQGAGTPSTGPLWPQHWAYDASLTSYGYDPAEAAALLDAAGYPLPSSSRDEASPPSRFRITCLIPENFSVWERMALKVQKNLFDIGVDMAFRSLPVEEFNKLVLAGDFEAAFNDMISGPTPGRAYIFWRSRRAFKGDVNVFGYENAEAERLFAMLQTSTNDAATRSTVRRLQQVLLRDPPALFLTWNTRARAIHGHIAVPDSGRDPLTTLWQWQPDSGTFAAAE
jgi:peptide/nickel transport system substrate-binding protein